MMMARFPLIFTFGAKERTGQSTDDSMTHLVTEKAASDTASDCAHEAALALLRIVRVGGVAGVTVWVGRVTVWRGSMSVIGAAVLRSRLTMGVAGVGGRGAVRVVLSLVVVLAAGVVWGWGRTVALLL